MRSLVVSASRSKDPVARSPDALARILRGDSPASFGPLGKHHFLDPADIAVLVLWTKDPGNMLADSDLHDTLTDFVEIGGRIYLELTLTGLGGSFMEPGIPSPDATFRLLERLFASGLVSPEWVLLRYDPLVDVMTGAGERLTNMTPEAFDEVCSRAASAGVSRITTSVMDLWNYPHVAGRLKRYGIRVQDHDMGELDLLLHRMDALAKGSGMELSVCVNPPLGELTERFGCIDGKLFNRLLRAEGLKASCDEGPHGGGQRAGCACTRSVDIGYSPGLRQCFTGGRGCLYCYSQRGPGKGVEEKVLELLDMASPVSFAGAATLRL